MMCWLLGHFARAHSRARGIELATCERCGAALFRHDEESGWQLRAGIRPDRDWSGGMRAAKVAPPRRHVNPRAYDGHEIRLRLDSIKSSKGGAALRIFFRRRGAGPARGSDPILIDLPGQLAANEPRTAARRARPRSFRQWWLPHHDRRPSGEDR